MTTNQAKKGAGLTLVQKTGLIAPDGTGLTDAAPTRLTPAIRTRRRYKARARKCKCGCGETVEPTPATPHKVFFNDNCRKRYHRRQEAKLNKTAPKAARELELRTCAFCAATFLVEVGSTLKYCKPSHRVAAAECRRDAAIQAFIDDNDMTPDDAIQMVERVGMKVTSEFLRQQGYVYDEARRHWAIKLRRVKG